MTDEDKKLISEYMGWKLPCDGNTNHAAICAIEDGSLCVKCEFHHLFGSNDASLCVAEMQKRGDIFDFYSYLIDIYNELVEQGTVICGADNFTAWLFNAENFFGAMSAWLKEGKK